MEILLLGGTGYLGGNIARALSLNGHKVICVVRSTSNTDYLDNFQGIELVSNEFGQLELTLRRRTIDWVINGVCSYKYNDSLYGDMFQSNIVFPLSVLNIAMKHSVFKYMTMGTSLPEDFNLYSFTKHKFSDFGHFLSVKDGITFLELELEMFYGGHNEPTNRFMNSCYYKLINGEQVKLTRGIQKRDLVRVEDVVSIVLKLVEADCFSGYNKLPVGSGVQHSIKEIVEYMKKVMGSNSCLNFGSIPDRQGEPDTLADIDWYSNIGYSNQFDFWEGIKDYCTRIRE